ncbi:hypothetical protein GCM10009773_35720 [Williamsia serinedens]
MGGVDEDRGPVLDDPVAQPVDAAETADPDLSDRQTGLRHPTGQRGDDGGAGVDQECRERSGFAGATQEEDGPGHGDSDSFVIRAAEYR